MMAEMSFNGKSVLSYYGLDLVCCYFSTASRKRHLVSIMGSDGEMDCMQGLGEPTYESRTMAAEFVIVGPPDDVIARLNDEVEGMTIQIILPDDPCSYVIGNAHIVKADVKAGGSVSVTATCKPWRLRTVPVIHSVPASAASVQYTWYNSGKRIAVPEITVEGSSVTIASDGAKIVLPAGTYLVPEMSIPGKGSRTVTIAGGAMTVKYQEASL